MAYISTPRLRAVVRKQIVNLIEQSAAAPAVEYPAGTFPLKVGSSGPAVEELQGKIGADVDGKFGPATLTAVKAKFGSDEVTKAMFNDVTGRTTKPAVPAGPTPKHITNAKRIARSIPSGEIDPKTNLPARKGSPMFAISAVEDAIAADPTGKELDLLAHAYYQNTTGDQSERFLLAAMLVAADKYGKNYPEAEDMRAVAEAGVQELNKLGTGSLQMGGYDTWRDSDAADKYAKGLAGEKASHEETRDVLTGLATQLKKDAGSLEDDFNIIGVGFTDEDGIAGVVRKYAELSDKHGRLENFPLKGDNATPIELLAGEFEEKFGENLQSHLEDELAESHPDVIMAFKKHYSKPPESTLSMVANNIKRHTGIGAAYQIGKNVVKGIGQVFGGMFEGGIFDGGELLGYDGENFKVLHEGNVYDITKSDLKEERQHLVLFND